MFSLQRQNKYMYKKKKPTGIYANLRTERSMFTDRERVRKMCTVYLLLLFSLSLPNFYKHFSHCIILKFGNQCSRVCACMPNLRRSAVQTPAYT